MVNLLTDYTTQIYHALSTDARPAAEPGDQLREIDTGKRFIFDGTSWNELSDGGGGGGGTPIQAPYKVASGSVIPASDTDDLRIDISDSGLSYVVHANIMIDDYTNYANYADVAPVVLRQIWNAPQSIPEFPYGSVVAQNTALKTDGTLATGSNHNNSYFANGVVHYGFYWSGYTFKAGVTYNYIVVGV